MCFVTLEQLKRVEFQLKVTVNLLEDKCTWSGMTRNQVHVIRYFSRVLHMNVKAMFTERKSSVPYKPRLVKIADP